MASKKKDGAPVQTVAPAVQTDIGSEPVIDQAALVHEAVLAAVAAAPAAHLIEPEIPVPAAPVEPVVIQETPIRAQAFEQMSDLTGNSEKTVESLKSGVAGVVAGFQKTQAEVKNTMEKAMMTAEEIVTFGQGNIEAFVKSGQIWTAGMQDLSKHIAATAQSQFEATVGSFKALSGVKSIKEAFDMQTAMVREQMEKAMSETSKLTDASIKLAEQTMAPLTARATMVAEKFGSVEKFSAMTKFAA